MTEPVQGEATQSDDLVKDLQGQIDAGGQDITEKQDEIRSLEHEVARLKASNDSLMAFHKELKASVSALGQAQNKATTERDEAQKGLPVADEISGRLAADRVRAIDDITASVEEESTRLRTEVAKQRAKLAEALGAEIDARAESAAADEALSDAKQRLGDHVKAIDAQAAQVRSLKGAARDAESKDQDSLAYQLIQEMKVAISYIDALLDPDRAMTLQAEAVKAWEQQAEAKSAEAKAGWQAAQAKESMKETQDALTAYDKERPKELARLVAKSEGEAVATKPAAGEAAAS